MRFLLSAFPVLIASLALIGWAARSEGIRIGLIAHDPMDPSTAVALVLLGTVGIFWPRYGQSRIAKTLAMLATGIVAIGAIVSLWQIVAGSYFGVDQWLFTKTLDARPGAPVRISPSTDLILLLLCPAILLLFSAVQPLAAGRENEKTVRRTIVFGQILAMAAALVAIFVLTGYLYHSISLTGIAALTPMPRGIAFGLLSLSFAVLGMYPQRGLVRFVTNDGPSGEMAQFLLPVSICVPVGLGWLRILGMHANLYDAEFGLDVSTMLNVVMLGSLTLVSARKLYQSDQKAKAVEQELLYRATHDSLTGLVTRAVFREQLTRRLRIAARRKGLPFAVFYLDLDGFKQVNDLLGHDAGDRLLIQVADILRACTRASDTVSRFGGDEFVILFEEIDSALTAEAMADRILASMPKSFGNGKISVPVGISIGITATARGDSTPDELLRDADTALYLAKTQGKNRYEVAGAA